MNESEKIPFDRIRTPTEVAIRSVILSGVVAAGHQQPRVAISNWLKKHNLWISVTPEESAFLSNDNPTQQQFIDATWRAEALHTLLWALKRIPTFSAPTHLCDLQQIILAMPELYSDPSAFIAEAQLQTARTIFEVLDPIYQVHWQVRDAQLFGRPVPNGFLPGAVRERHHAYNWLTCYFDQDWDDISTDT